MYIKPINDLDPGLNLLEKFFVLYCIVSNNVLLSNMLCIGCNFKHEYTKMSQRAVVSKKGGDINSGLKNIYIYIYFCLQIASHTY